MTRAMRVLLVGGGIVLAFGLALTAWRAIAYLESARAVSSTSGLVVFRVDGELVQYAPYVAGTEPVIVGLGVALLVIGVIVAALAYGSSSASRASTAGSNADAHTR